MPRKSMKYETTMFYKLCCKDPTVTELYVGHTTNWTKRKQRHKHACINPNIKSHNYVYRYIRDNGHWDNWEMVLLDKSSCAGVLDAKQKEREYLEALCATLNKQVPNRTKKEYHQKNKKHLTEKHNESCSHNKDKITEYKKHYYENNKGRTADNNK